jgi:transcription initiation factor IIF auxiliary subunit
VSPEEEEKLKLKRLIEAKLPMLLEKQNADLMRYVQQLGQEGLSHEQKVDIETKIDQTKAKMA